MGLQGSTGNGVLHGKVNRGSSGVAGSLAAANGSLNGSPEGNKVHGQTNRLMELRGYSAYEVAVINGFEGTQEEWLETQKGQKGDQGASVVSARLIAGQMDDGSPVIYVTGAELTEVP